MPTGTEKTLVASLCPSVATVIDPFASRSTVPYVGWPPLHFVGSVGVPVGSGYKDGFIDDPDMHPAPG
jgi:hypothetical protein